LVKFLVTLLVASRVFLCELLGASALVYGIAMWSTAGAWVAVGLLLLIKAFELDARGEP